MAKKELGGVSWGTWEGDELKVEIPVPLSTESFRNLEVKKWDERQLMNRK